jgi:hypothetical protein
MKLFMLHNIPPHSLLLFVCVGWRVYTKTFRKDKKTQKFGQSLAASKKSLELKKKPTLGKTTHKSSVDKFLRVLFYILLYDIFPPQIGSIYHPKTTQNVFK